MLRGSARLNSLPKLCGNTNLCSLACVKAKLHAKQQNAGASGLTSNHKVFSSVQVPKEVLEWNTRAPKLLDKILETAADVVCLQELNHYDDFFLPQMQQRGYNGIFNPKKFSPAAKFGCPPDGCAVFFKDSKFLLREEVLIQHAIICCLQSVQTGQELVLATTHLKAKAGEENDAIRAGQVQQLLEKLLTFTRDGRLPSVVCGDFNTNPQSGVYGMMRNHSLRFLSVYACGGIDLASNCSMNLICRLHGGSQDAGAESEPSFTTWKFRSNGEKQETIDYIWFADCQKLLAPQDLWRLPDVASIGVDGLPSEAIPSDHLPLLCEFAWREKSSQKIAISQQLERSIGYLATSV